MGQVLGPRVVIAGTRSGAGKTSVATGLMAALRRSGTAVASAKVGPDFIDPGYHALATGRPPRNLDPWLCGPDAIGPLAGRAGAGADLLVVEGVMGLFDGAADGAPSSTADVARLLAAPVILVADASATSQSLAAVVHGFATLDPTVTVAGVVVNQVASDSHEAMVRTALAPLGIPVVGVLRRDPALAWRDRHLGLIPVVEQRAEVARSLDRLADAVAASCDLDLVVRIAASAAPVSVADPVLPPIDPIHHPQPRPRIAVAGGPAFSFTYPDNLEALAAAGAELVPFDPCSDAALPEGCTGLVAGGGFPEVYADHLADNRPMLDDVRRRIERDDLVTWAECGGLLWLGRALDGRSMVGAIAADGHMTERLTLGYRTAVTNRPSPLGTAGTVLRGHEFHYSDLDPPGDALTMEGRTGTTTGGHASPRLLASYLHVHLGGDPAPAVRFVTACRG